MFRSLFSMLDHLGCVFILINKILFQWYTSVNVFFLFFCNFCRIFAVFLSIIFEYGLWVYYLWLSVSPSCFRFAVTISPSKMYLYIDASTGWTKSYDISCKPIRFGKFQTKFVLNFFPEPTRAPYHKCHLKHLLKWNNSCQHFWECRPNRYSQRIYIH